MIVDLSLLPQIIVVLFTSVVLVVISFSIFSVCEFDGVMGWVVTIIFDW